MQNNSGGRKDTREEDGRMSCKITLEEGKEGHEKDGKMRCEMTGERMEWNGKERKDMRKKGGRKDEMRNNSGGRT